MHCLSHHHSAINSVDQITNKNHSNAVLVMDHLCLLCRKGPGEEGVEEDDGLIQVPDEHPVNLGSTST